jgi:hypothetical protein
MRHADALSRCVNAAERNLALTKDIIQEEQAKDSLCEQYKQYEDFWLDEDNVLYRQGSEEQP